ncbi:MAG: hypothetical protein LPJ94_08985 [Thauera sp.]|nr:hypothetical protein [Thauera sp.]
MTKAKNKLTPLLLTLAAAFTLLPASSAVHAVALGEVLSLSALGEPLRVDLQLAAGRLEEAGECLRIAPGAADAGPWVTRARISTSSRGDKVVTISAPTPVNEPVLRLGIDNVCASRLRREYTLLLPFPVARPTLQAETVAAPSPAPAKTQPSRPTPPAPQPARAARHQTWTTAPGESLESLAAALYPHEPAIRERFIADAARANPTLYPDRDSRARALPPGTELLVPDPARVRAPATAGSGSPARTAERKPAQATPAAPRRPAAAPPPSAPREDRLVVDVAEDATADAPAGPRYDASADSSARERQLVAAIDRSIQAQVDLLERIRELERIQAELIDRANRLDAAMPAQAKPAPPAQQPASPAIETNVPASPEPRSDWPLYLALFAGIVAAILGLQALDRRRRDTAAARAASLSTTTQPAAGVWPEEARAASGLEPSRGAVQLDHPSTEETPPTPSYEWAAPSVAPIAVENENIEEHESAVELAEIMMSFGRVQGAAETLAEFIRGNPQQAVQPWLKLLDVYRAAGMRAEFDGLSRQLNKTFNVKTVTWDNYDEARLATHHVEDMPHVVDMLVRTWRTVECQAYLEKLLRDNREGTRQGFPLSVVDELLMLASVLENQLGRYRAPGADSAG